MSVIDLRGLPPDELVLHFGGRPNEVNAYTFSNSLLSIAEAMQEINRQLHPELSIEIAIEALGEGSFRAKIKTSRKQVVGWFKAVPGNIVVGILTILIYERLISDPHVTITVNDDSYVVQSGADRIIMPREAWEAKESLLNPHQVRRHIAKTFEVLDEDPSVTEFGIAKRIGDKNTVGDIPRANFPRLAIVPQPLVPTEDRRHQDIEAGLVIIKAILERSERRWQFVWNGIRISAPIKDEGFFVKMASREYEFGQGDILHVTLRLYQIRDDANGAFINEKYEVIEVHYVTHGPKQLSLGSDM